MPRLKRRQLDDDSIRAAIRSMTDGERINLLDTLIKDFRNRQTVAVAISLEIEKKSGIRIRHKGDELTVEMNFNAEEYRETPRVIIA